MSTAHERHEAWVRAVRDPAYANTHGPVKIDLPDHRISYELAPLPDGRTAWRCEVLGPKWGTSTPWRAEATSADARESVRSRLMRAFAQKDRAPAAWAAIRGHFDQDMLV